MGIPGCNRIVAFAGVISPVSRDAAELLAWWNLVEQVWQYWGVTNATAGDFDRTDLQCLLINPDMYFALYGPVTL
jgi:hypothetical protein